jgi:hypothetical protein
MRDRSHDTHTDNIREVGACPHAGRTVGLPYGRRFLSLLESFEPIGSFLAHVNLLYYSVVECVAFPEKSQQSQIYILKVGHNLKIKMGELHACGSLECTTKRERDASFSSGMCSKLLVVIVVVRKLDPIYDS